MYAADAIARHPAHNRCPVSPRDMLRLLQSKKHRNVLPPFPISSCVNLCTRQDHSFPLSLSLCVCFCTVKAQKTESVNTSLKEDRACDVEMSRGDV